MDVLIQIAQLILSLSILVIFHEFGHFAFAKLFKTKVEKFYLFFDAWFSLFKFKKGDTEYGIGWIPLGGYVKIAGMIDESMDKEQMKKPPQPWEFRSKPAWQRLLIMLGGVMVNFILAGLIYVAILFAWGDDYLPVENAKYGIAGDSVAYELGFMDGDKILKINDNTPDRFTQIIPEIILNTPARVELERNGTIKTVTINEDHVAKIISTNGKSKLISPRFKFTADTILPKSNAEKAGILKGDQFIGLDSEELEFYDQYVKKFTGNPATEFTAKILRNRDTLDIQLETDEDGKIGIITISGNQFTIAHKDYSLAESVPAGLKKGIDQTKNYLKQFKLIFNPETKAYKSLGSFITIGNLFPKLWDWHSFWSLTAFLSIILGVVNILPIPALDGGHVMFVLYEMITGRKPGDKFLEVAQIVGFVLLIGLMIFALKNDIVNNFF
ncbi:MAG: RIP metalloprotease RseP [Bacteroidota bacterium]|nr:RIP metalloprotease RseP [Bacteroidota bacterium]